MNQARMGGKEVLFDVPIPVEESCRGGLEEGGAGAMGGVWGGGGG